MSCDSLGQMYKEYKTIGIKIYQQLDPEGKLERRGLPRARKIVPYLVNQLPKQQHAAQDDEEPDDDTGNDEGALTLTQADFFAFLEVLMALTKKAAAHWKEVAQNKLSIEVATILSSILLREAKNLIDIARLLDESRTGERASKVPMPWAATTSRDKGNIPMPQLTQDWVDALNKSAS
ncbi:hypothetical protein F5Y08DRAFT_345212 [Xylaria arbuscula]|nr:hypothetical protein F5Y08DRAFT_345212 [Xylaria arbuscula]